MAKCSDMIYNIYYLGLGMGEGVGVGVNHSVFSALQSRLIAFILHRQQHIA